MSDELDPIALEEAAKAFEEASLGGNTEGAWQQFQDEVAAAIEAYLASLKQRGVRLMPREATDGMLQAWMAKSSVPSAARKLASEVWRAMFDAHAPASRNEGDGQ